MICFTLSLLIRIVLKTLKAWPGTLSVEMSYLPAAKDLWAPVSPREGCQDHSRRLLLLVGSHLRDIWVGQLRYASEFEDTSQVGKTINYCIFLSKTHNLIQLQNLKFTELEEGGLFT